MLSMVPAITNEFYLAEWKDITADDKRAAAEDLKALILIWAHSINEVVKDNLIPVQESIKRL